MAKPRIVILGAGLGGAVAAFEIKDAVGDGADVSVVSQGDRFHFVPSNPWVAVHWRKRDAIEVDLPPVFAKRGIAFTGVGARQVSPALNQVELNDGAIVGYDYLVIATGPDLAFDEIAGLGPHGGFTQSVCHVAQGCVRLICWRCRSRPTTPATLTTSPGDCTRMPWPSWAMARPPGMKTSSFCLTIPTQRSGRVPVNA